MKRLLATTAIILGMAAQGWATPITFTGTGDGSSIGNLKAEATFNTSGTNLLVTLSNTSTFDVMAPLDVLTAVFFKVAGNPALTPVSALLNAGSIVHFGSQGSPAPGNVGGEWGYSVFPGLGNLAGISSSGLGLFGGPNFGGNNLQNPLALDGLQYGITSTGDNTATGNTPVTGSNALIKYSVIFTLSGLPQGFDPSSDISSVIFQYGTALSEPKLTGRRPPQEIPVPEPGTIMLLGGGLAGLAFYGRRRIKK